MINKKRHNEIDYQTAHYGDAHPNKKIKRYMRLNENQQKNISVSQSRSSVLLNKYDYSIHSIPHC